MKDPTLLFHGQNQVLVTLEEGEEEILHTPGTQKRSISQTKNLPCLRVPHLNPKSVGKVASIPNIVNLVLFELSRFLSSLAASRYSNSCNLSCIDLVSDHCTSVTIVASTQGPVRRKVYSSSSGSTQPAQLLKQSLDRDKKVSKSTYSELGLPFWQSNWFLALLLIMAAGFFALALFLYLGLELPNGSPSSAMAAEGVEITYGSVIKLMHERTKFRLHSHDVPYGSGSGQQSVTGFQGVDDSNSYWVVRPVPDTSAKQGDAITHGTVIRFQHMRTRKWLHSHLHASPISGNLEVSCFGSEHQSDTGDHWRLEIEGSGKTWRQDQKVRLRHVDTQGYLHSHDKKYARIAGGQQEVCGVREKRADNVWLAAEGVYLPLNNSK